NRGGSVVLEIGEQKHARDFEAAKEQCRIDNPLEIACNVLWIVYPALLFCRLKIPCVFLLPDLQNDRAATVPAAP
ncbi:hypothetical protein, partial [Klebsiella pneumoniae]|uniref:hypothetical protein n=1 Tax=Enterobacteriaceae TaxID=543 RepID=UPI001AEE1E85